MILKNNPLVTVYIVSKNHNKYVIKSIKSVLAQSYKNLEIFFIDDNSIDGTFKKAKRIKNKKIKYYNFKKNKGLQSISNFFLKLARGK